MCTDDKHMDNDTWFHGVRTGPGHTARTVPNLLFIWGEIMRREEGELSTFVLLLSDEKEITIQSLVKDRGGPMSGD